MNKIQNPIVSVCIQTYNHGKYIAECLESVLAQRTTFPIEVIIGEDESNDGTREICIEYAARYPELIKLFLRRREDVIYLNGSPTSRYNMIQNFAACSGDYMALTDGDDYWTDPLKLQKQYDFLSANPDYAICSHPVMVFDQSSGKIREDTITRKVPETTDINDLAQGNFMHTNSVMLKNDFELPEWFKKVFLGDWTSYMICTSDRKIKMLDEPMAVYRVHDQGLWSKTAAKRRIKITLDTFNIVHENLELSPQTARILEQKIEFYQKKLKYEYTPFKIIANSISKVLKGALKIK